MTVNNPFGTKYAYAMSFTFLGDGTIPMCYGPNGIQIPKDKQVDEGYSESMKETFYTKMHVKGQVVAPFWMGHCQSLNWRDDDSAEHGGMGASYYDMAYFGWQNQTLQQRKRSGFKPYDFSAIFGPSNWDAKSLYYNTRIQPGKQFVMLVRANTWFVMPFNCPLIGQMQQAVLFMQEGKKIATPKPECQDCYTCGDLGRWQPFRSFKETSYAGCTQEKCEEIGNYCWYDESKGGINPCQVKSPSDAPGCY